MTKGGCSLGWRGRGGTQDSVELHANDVVNFRKHAVAPAHGYGRVGEKRLRMLGHALLPSPIDQRDLPDNTQTPAVHTPPLIHNKLYSHNSFLSVLSVIDSIIQFSDVQSLKFANFTAETPLI